MWAESWLILNEPGVGSRIWLAAKQLSGGDFAPVPVFGQPV
ncbi:hypothetical protein ACPOL_4429 [Acidisarcina polymorpha]|uniref:Uncharacterized protein n=1 Tax=Acidisarcina polymorpha TaxID=2211140 RepID=A0A2Z5G3L3_9BACT|nr:hypothetical protein ACPOL_4429 [Acidisarcina polymorpha]